MADKLEELEVVWDGGPLLPPRDTKPGPLWSPPNRIYTKKSKYWERKRGVPPSGGKEKSNGKE